MARELINRNQIHYTWWQHQDGTFSDGVTLQSVIDQMPIVDAVEVVRCKDCKHLYNRIGYYRCTHYKGLRGISEDSFCGYGERSGKA